MNALGPSLAPYIRSSRTLKKWVKPVAVWYTDLMGYRSMGLKYDDLQMEELPEVQRALGRLTPREAYDRAYRMKLASHRSVLHKPLPKEEWLNPAEVDKRYLQPHIAEVIKEDEERAAWDNMTIQRK
ncbi:cytochrome b-c1 complex subunit 7 [Hygrophoropsis aurantiaca]|uniref:Cytochrome b-c1 complex subunit 7 n=1 Tax=Hygrophoropsis aurantiaca TaxID=72124 RepID=A0ACB8AT96_9AGAM|nr:cytochrome b-c1 complex subunit 7 [Hygrophoropsis aurantiaca]